MAVYPLAAILTLRAFKQEKAMHQVQVCEKGRSQAKKAVIRATEAHQAYMAWLAQEEIRRYDGIMDTVMTQDDVVDFKTGLLAIRAKESDFLERIIQAKHRKEQADNALKQAKKDLIQAQKKTMKIEAHQEIWREMMRIEEERAMELEMEDFISPMVMPA